MYNARCYKVKKSLNTYRSKIATGEQNHHKNIENITASPGLSGADNSPWDLELAEWGEGEGGGVDRDLSQIFTATATTT